MIIDCALLYDSDYHKRCIREESCELNIRVIDKLLIHTEVCISFI